MSINVSKDFFQRHHILPLETTDEQMVVAIRPTTPREVLEDLRLALQLEIVPVVMQPEELDKKLQSFMVENANIDENEDEEGNKELDVDISQDLLADVADAPIVRQLNAIFLRAMETRTSDIHIEPFEEFTSVRMRIDGVLHETNRIPRKYTENGQKNDRHAQILARLKVMSNLDLAERRHPQDGRLHVHSGDRHIDVRLSTVPTIYGERAVMRLLEKNMKLASLEQLGMITPDRELVTDIVSHPYGVFLITGPTGSGKTTTLYAILDQIRSPQRNIITIEDPVEYRIDGVGQIQIKEDIGMTFASALRAILRQDPDVIMVGEIRDPETADIAIHAALTGHLVLSTLHTNDAPTAATRLLDLGIPPYLLSSAMLGAMAQRLVRNLCPHCKQPYIPSQADLHRLGLNSLPAGATCFKPVGCEKCHGSGYLGRSGIYEIMSIDDELRERIAHSQDSRTLGKVAHEHGMHTLLEDGVSKVLRGETSVEEALHAARL